MIDDPKENNCLASAKPIPLEPPDIKTYLSSCSFYYLQVEQLLPEQLTQEELLLLVMLLELHIKKGDIIRLVFLLWQFTHSLM